tara:strand:- start:1085 stop:1396 length:312 start_codon:yes stop_codon:yes gene_type:complete
MTSRSRLHKLGTGEYEHYFVDCEKYNIKYSSQITYERMVELAIEQVRYDKEWKLCNFEFIFEKEAIKTWEFDLDEHKQNDDNWSLFIGDSISEIVGCMCRKRG